MLRDQSFEEFGPTIDFREYSFLQNPRLPKQVKESFLEVQVCEQKLPKCHATNCTERQGFIKLPKHSTQEMIIQLFSMHKDVKVIEFSSMMDLFGGFDNAEVETRFRNRVQGYVGIWCCVMNKDPGHIFYDMYWDEKPDWKPVPGLRS